MKKWLLRGLLVSLIAWTLFWLMAIITDTKVGGEEDLFFRTWKVSGLTNTPYGLQLIMDNPDKNGVVSKVVVAVAPDRMVLGYWYFEKDAPFSFIIGKNGYERNATHENQCILCHRKIAL